MKRVCADCASDEVSFVHNGDCFVCTIHRCPTCVPIEDSVEEWFEVE